MQYRSRAVAPASPSAASTMTSSVRSSSASSSTHSDDGGSSSSLLLHSEEEPEDLGDPDVLAHELCDFFGGRAAAPKPKKVKAPKQKAVKVELALEAKATGAQPRESTSRLRRLCKAIVPGSKA